MSDQAEAHETPPWLESLASISHDRCTFCNEIGSFPHTCKPAPATELVATFQPEGDPGIVSVLITPPSMEDLWWQIDGWADDDTEGVIGTVTIARKPVGFVASLPEFTGW